jgi:hypothetical protein
MNLPAFINFPLVNFSIKRFFTQSSISFFLSKLFSISLLVVFIFLFGTIDHYDRFSRVAIMLVFIANAFLPYELFKFHHIDLNNFRNLPVKPLFILLQALVVLIILNLPEVVLIFRNFPRIIEPAYICVHIFNGLAISLFLYAYLIYFNSDLKTYISRIFWGSILIVLALLFGLPGYLLFILLCSGIFYFYFTGYYKFELVFNQVNN